MTKSNPQIDRSAEIAQAGPAPAPMAAAPESGDVPMPAAENEAPSRFVPGAGINTTDVFEITLMYLLELTGSPAHFPPGTLRGLALSAVRTGELSESARRYMKELQQTAEVPAQPAAQAVPTGPVQ